MLTESRITNPVDTTISRRPHRRSRLHRARRMMFVLAALATWPSFAFGTALDDYVAAPDPNYSFSLVRTLSGAGYTEYHLDMISQKWRDESEVNRPLWEHRLIIVVPDTVSSSVALQGIVDGNNGQDLAALPFEREWAVNTKTVVASLRQVPNQPLVFTGDRRARSEDEILAYTFAKFMDTGDETWPALLPMVKSAVRAMDTVQTFVAEESGGAMEIEKFVVAGPSKRAWTSWLTAAVDSRVEAIIPVVFDVLNIDEQMEHHRRVYEGVTRNIVGGYAAAVRDYVNEKVMDRLSTPEGQALLEIIDPYEYRDRLTVPKLLINSTGDQFFAPDSARSYFHDLVGPKYLRYVPNTGHGIPPELWKTNFESFYESVIHDEPLPRFAWTVEPDGSIRVATETTPLEVRQWQATTATHRDFRIDSLGPRWTSALLADQGSGTYIGRVASPPTGHTAFFVEMKFPSGDATPHTFTTEIVVASVDSRERFVRGDCNGDGAVNVSDVSCSLAWLFGGAAAPGCVAAADSNGDAAVDIADPLSLLNFLFTRGSAPVTPYPDCGPGTLASDDELGCESPPDCR